MPLKGISLSWLLLAVAPTGRLNLLLTFLLDKLRFFTAAASVPHGLLSGIDRII